MITVRKSHPARVKGTGAVELVEEAAGLVRRSSAKDLCCYALGALPFLFYVLFFFCRRTGVAGLSHLASESLTLSLLYLWMKYWQSVYAGRLLAALRSVPPQPVFRVGPALVQAALQPWSWIVLPIALILVVPFGWCHAFFQNVTVLGGEGDAGTVFRRASRQAGLFPGRNLLVISIMTVLFLVVFGNLCAATVLLPSLMKKLIGIETVFSRSFHFLFTTSLPVLLAVLSYLIVDPFVKASYVLRCYYGECIVTGADLLTELREVRRTAAKAGSLFLAAVSILGFLTVFPVEAASASLQSVQFRSTAVREMDCAISDVMKRPEFAQPPFRESLQAGELQAPGFLASCIATLKEWTNQICRWIEGFAGWFEEHLRNKPRHDRSAVDGDGGTVRSVPVVMYGLPALLLSVWGVMLWRRSGTRRMDAGEGRRLSAASGKMFAVFLALMVCAFGFGIYTLLSEQFERGETFPPYSSFRSDDRGTRALYLALGQAPGIDVRRNFFDTSRLPLERGATFFFLGVDVRALRLSTKKDIQGLERLAQRGNRLVFAFAPLRHSTGTDTQKKDSDGDGPPPSSWGKNPQGDAPCGCFSSRWSIIAYDTLPEGDAAGEEQRAVLSEEESGLPETIPIGSSLSFRTDEMIWKTVYSSEEEPVFVERAFGAGSIVFVADSYLATNRAMREQRYPNLLLRLLGGNRTAVFDETHLGIFETPGVMTLIKKYRLAYFPLSLLLLAGLYLWKNVPFASSAGSGRFDDSGIRTDTDAVEGLINLLRRNIPRSELLDVCFREWAKSFSRKYRESDGTLERMQSIVNQEMAKAPAKRDPEAGCRRMTGILKERKQA